MANKVRKVRRTTGNSGKPIREKSEVIVVQGCVNSKHLIAYVNGRLVRVAI